MKKLIPMSKQERTGYKSVALLLFACGLMFFIPLYKNLFVFYTNTQPGWVASGVSMAIIQVIIILLDCSIKKFSPKLWRVMNNAQ
jgi:hypothetical protein